MNRPVFRGDQNNPLNVSCEAPDHDLRVAGKILHAVHSQSFDPAKRLDTLFLERVAHEVAERGVDHARSFVLGYWYATGINNHDTVAALLEVLK